MAAIETELVLKPVEAFAGALITAVGEPAIGLQQDRRAEIAVLVPPVARPVAKAPSACLRRPSNLRNIANFPHPTRGAELPARRAHPLSRPSRFRCLAVIARSAATKQSRPSYALTIEIASLRSQWRRHVIQRYRRWPEFWRPFKTRDCR